jgi:hypothetical protein
VERAFKERRKSMIKIWEEHFLNGLLNELVKPKHELEQGSTVAISHVDGTPPAFDILVSVKARHYGELHLSVTGFYIEAGERKPFHAAVQWGGEERSTFIYGEVFYINWEGRSYTPEDWEKDLSIAFERLGQGPYYVGYHDVGVLLGNRSDIDQARCLRKGQRFQRCDFDEELTEVKSKEEVKAFFDNP